MFKGQVSPMTLKISMNYLKQIALTILLIILTLFVIYNFVPLNILKFFEIKGEQTFGSTIITILGTDTLSASRPNLNTNFTNLNADKLQTGSTAATLSVGTLTVGSFSATTTSVNSMAGGFVSSASSSITSLHGMNFFASSSAIVDGILVMPNGAAPTCATAGCIANDTSISGQLIVASSSSVILAQQARTFWVPTTTLAARGSYGSAGTTTLEFSGFGSPVTFQSMSCTTDPTTGNGTSTVRLGDGTNYMQFGLAADRPGGLITNLTSNNALIARETLFAQFGTNIGNADAISCTILYTYDRR